jgi:NAD(P)-dependent dehydrogenase (short-subunit alcohol dehydrogenase family)
MPVALITGGGSGIGQAVANALVREGFDIVVTGRRLAPLEATAAQASETGRRVLPVQADVTEPSAVRALFATALGAFGRLDLLFNNAGRNAPAVALEELEYADWAAVIATNLTGAFLCSQMAFDAMKRQNPMGGRIINNGSISAHAPRPNSAAYTASKHGITGLTRSLSLDGRRYNIACGQIDIGNAATEMAGRFATGVEQADGRVAPEPTIDVEHVAQAVVYMAKLPLDANVQFMTVMATKMPYIGRG